MIKTKITKMLDIEHPVIQGGMQWVSRAELVSAISNAGALGILTALTQPTPEDLGREIKKCREMTDKPFGVNLTLLPTIKPVPYEEYVDVIIKSGIKIIETAGRNPEAFIPALKDAGIKIIHKCTSVRHALKAEKLGCDMVSVDGFECAGHPGEDDIPNLILLPRAADVLKIPFIASGGFCDGRGLTAALALGADAINMGSRFVATKEAPVHENVKQKIVESDELQTTLILRTLKNSARMYKNSVAEKILEIEQQEGETDFADIAPLVSGLKGQKVMEEGQMESGIWSIGPVIGLINDIPTCKELVERIINEAEKIIKSRLVGVIT